MHDSYTCAQNDLDTQVRTLVLAQAATARRHGQGSAASMSQSQVPGCLLGKPFSPLEDRCVLCTPFGGGREARCLASFPF